MDSRTRACLYDAAGPAKLAMLFAVLAYAAGYAEYMDAYFCYIGCSMEGLLG